MLCEEVKLIPPGWKRKEVVRKKGMSAGKIDVCIYSPNGKKFRSKRELDKYIKDKQLPYKIEDFNFSTNKNKTIKENSTQHLTLPELSTDPSPNVSLQSVPSILPTDEEIQSFDSNNFNKSTENTLKGYTTACDKSKKTGSRISLCLSVMEGEWITDDAIQTHFTFMESVLDDNLQIHLMDPAISQATKCLVDKNEFIMPLNLSEKSYIFIPINDSTSASYETSGTHWSLLLYAKAPNKYYYFDSLGLSNYSSAVKTAKELHKVLGKEDEIVIETCKTPQQDSKDDCGVYLILIAESLLIQITQLNLNDILSFNIPNFTAYDIWTKRSQLASLLHGGTFFHTNKKKLMSSIIYHKLENECISTSGIKNANEGLNKINNNIYRKDGWSQVKLNHGNKAQKQSLLTADFTAKNRYEVLQNYSNQNEDNSTNIPDVRSSVKVQSFKTKNNVNNVPVKSSRFNKAGRKNRNHKFDNQGKLPTFGKLACTTNGCPKVRLIICSDSQGRSVASEVEKLTSRRIKAFGYVRANTTLIQVIDSACIEDETPVVILGGTNDSLNGSLKDIYCHLEEKLKLVSKIRPVFLTTVPIRHDVPLDHRINADLRVLNNYIEELSARLNNVHLINLNHLTRSHFSRHGLHLSNYGKTKLANAIIQAVTKLYLQMESSTCEINSQIKTCSLPEVESPPTSSVSADMVFMPLEQVAIIKENIKLIERDMKDIVDIYCNEASVAFAHCISADFDHVKQMSKGVAVTFKNKFGKPRVSDYCNNNLTCQKTTYGATVYSLVTKPKYFLNANNFSNYNSLYDLAFSQLTEDFKARKLQTLICSPMGCSRDRVPPEHFLSNLQSFQMRTGASILIVTFNDKSEEFHKKGQSSASFVKHLQQLGSIKIPESNSSRLEGHATPTQSPQTPEAPNTTCSESDGSPENSSTVPGPAVMFPVCETTTSSLLPDQSPVISDVGGFIVNGTESVSEVLLPDMSVKSNDVSSPGEMSLKYVGINNTIVCNSSNCNDHSNFLDLSQVHKQLK